jgi:hypothetical protein
LGRLLIDQTLFEDAFEWYKYVESQLKVWYNYGSPSYIQSRLTKIYPFLFLGYAISYNALNKPDDAIYNIKYALDSIKGNYSYNIDILITALAQSLHAFKMKSNQDKCNIIINLLEFIENHLKTNTFPEILEKEITNTILSVFYNTPRFYTRGNLCVDFETGAFYFNKDIIPDGILSQEQRLVLYKLYENIGNKVNYTALRETYFPDSKNYDKEQNADAIQHIIVAIRKMLKFTLKSPIVNVPGVGYKMLLE